MVNIMSVMIYIPMIMIFVDAEGLFLTMNMYWTPC